MLIAILLAQLLYPGGVGEAVRNPQPLTVPYVGVYNLIPEDENTVLHLVGGVGVAAGTGWMDIYGRATATLVGTTTMTTSTGRSGVTGFSTNNYYTLATSTGIDTTGDFTVCLSVSGGTATGNQGVIGGTDSPVTKGWAVFLNNGGANGKADVFSTLSAASLGWYTYGSTLNLICGGRSGLTMLSAMNGSTPQATATTSTPAAYGAAHLIGTWSAAKSLAFTGIIHEVWFSRSPPTSAKLSDIASRFYGTSGSFGEPITFSRNLWAYYAPVSAASSTLVLAPTSTARVSDLGVLIEPAATNLSIWNRNPVRAATLVGTAIAAPIVSTSTSVSGDGTIAGVSTTFATLTAAAQQSVLEYAITTVSGTAYTASAYFKGATSSGVLYMSLEDAPYSVTSTAACSVSTSTWSRCSLTITANAATMYWDIGPNTFGANKTGQPTSQAALTVFIDGLQTEAGSVTTSLIPTQASSQTRPADVITWPNVLDPNEGCLQADITPTWTGASAGTVGFALGSPAGLLYVASGNVVQFYAGSGSVASANASYVAGVKRTYRSEWSKTLGTNYVKNITDSTSGSVAFAAISPTTFFASSSSSPVSVKNVKWGLTPRACDQ